MEQGIVAVFVLLLLAGIVQCFLGRRLVVLSMAITGFYVATVLVALSVFYVLEFESQVSILVGLAGGVLGGLFAIMFYHLSLVLQGLAVGALFAYIVADMFNAEASVAAALMAAIGLAVGISSLVWRRWSAIAVTAFIGPFIVLQSFAQLTTGFNAETLVTIPQWQGFLVWSLLMAGGIFVQHMYTSELNFGRLAGIIKKKVLQVVKKDKADDYEQQEFYTHDKGNE